MARPVALSCLTPVVDTANQLQHLSLFHPEIASKPFPTKQSGHHSHLIIWGTYVPFPGSNKQLNWNYRLGFYTNISIIGYLPHIVHTDPWSFPGRRDCRIRSPCYFISISGFTFIFLNGNIQKSVNCSNVYDTWVALLPFKPTRFCW